MEELRKRIELKAYENFLSRGMSHGNDREDWLKAEKEIQKKDNNQLNNKSTKKAFTK
jgi:hypothetical protein